MTIHTVGDVDAVGRATIERLIAEGRCTSASYHQSTDSTNTLALKDLQSGSVPAEHCPKIYLADNQTAGRGRHGRNWISDGGSLTFSLILDRPSSDRAMRLLSLAVGVGLARSLEHEFAPLSTALKWPNDLHIDGGKLAGILMETSSHTPQRIVVGVGVNVNDAPDLVGHPEAAESRSLSQVVGRHLHRYDVLGPLITGITVSVRDVCDAADNVLADFRDRCLLTGRAITFQDGTDRREGVCLGITDDGELIVKSDRGTQHLRSGEARLVRSRPQLHPPSKEPPNV